MSCCFAQIVSYPEAKKLVLEMRKWKEGSGCEVGEVRELMVNIQVKDGEIEVGREVTRLMSVWVAPETGRGPLVSLRPSLSPLSASTV